MNISNLITISRRRPLLWILVLSSLFSNPSWSGSKIGGSTYSGGSAVAKSPGSSTNWSYSTSSSWTPPKSSPPSQTTTTSTPSSNWSAVIKQNPAQATPVVVVPSASPPSSSVSSPLSSLKSSKPLTPQEEIGSPWGSATSPKGSAKIGGAERGSTVSIVPNTSTNHSTDFLLWYLIFNVNNKHSSADRDIGNPQVNSSGSGNEFTGQSKDDFEPNLVQERMRILEDDGKLAELIAKYEFLQLAEMEIKGDQGLDKLSQLFEEPNTKKVLSSFSRLNSIILKYLKLQNAKGGHEFSNGQRSADLEWSSLLAAFSLFEIARNDKLLGIPFLMISNQEVEEVPSGEAHSVSGKQKCILEKGSIVSWEKIESGIVTVSVDRSNGVDDGPNKSALCRSNEKVQIELNILRSSLEKYKEMFSKSYQIIHNN